MLFVNSEIKLKTVKRVRGARAGLRVKRTFFISMLRTAQVMVMKLTKTINSTCLLISKNEAVRGKKKRGSRNVNEMTSQRIILSVIFDVDRFDIAFLLRRILLIVSRANSRGKLTKLT